MVSRSRMPPPNWRQVAANFLDDGLDRFFVDRLAGKRTVEVHQVQALRALVHPVPRHRGGILGKHRGVFHEALFQAHAGAVFEINRGNNQHDELGK